MTKQTEVETLSPVTAWGYAAQWGSYVRDGDPGAVMYTFDEHFRFANETHRQALIDYIDDHCLPIARERRSTRDINMLRRLRRTAELAIPMVSQ